MKKLFSISILMLLSVALIVPTVTLAQEKVPGQCTISRDVGVTGCNIGVCVFETNSKCGICCLLNTLYGITDWVFVVLIALSGIFVVLGAFSILTAAGSPDKVTSGRNYVLYAAIGLAVAFLARAIPAIVKMIVGA